MARGNLIERGRIGAKAMQDLLEGIFAAAVGTGPGLEREFFSGMLALLDLLLSVNHALINRGHARHHLLHSSEQAAGAGELRNAGEIAEPARDDFKIGFRLRQAMGLLAAAKL